MKKHLWSPATWLLWALALSFSGCGEEKGYPDVDGQNPSMTLVTNHIESGAGHRFTIEGTLSDRDGIASVNLKCADLYLNKTIDLIEIYGAPKETYELSYYYDLKRDEIGERFTVQVTVTDVGGRSTSQEVLITMDGDFADPVFTVAPDATVTVLMKSEVKYALRFTVTDDRKLDYVTINIPGVDGFDNRRVEADEKQTLAFEEKIILPNVVKDYLITITAVDKKGNQKSVGSVLSVSEMPDFPKMYLADVSSVAELNSDVFGVPMLIEHTGQYQYKARYYNEEAGTEVFFLPQKNDFSPICFGLDPDDENKLTDDPEVAKPLVLQQARVYYEITFNVKTGEYDVSTYPVSAASNRLPQAIGSDFYLNPAEPQFVIPFRIGVLGNLPGCNGNPSGILIFTQDTANPNLFYTDEMELDAGKKLNFIIHNKHDWGWWDYCLWRVDNSDDPEKFIYGGADANPKPADIWGKPTVTTYGKYQFRFDAHLERGKLVRVN